MEWVALNPQEQKMKSQIRKIIVQVDEVLQEGGQAVNPPTRRALAMAVIFIYMILKSQSTNPQGFYFVHTHLIDPEFLFVNLLVLQRDKGHRSYTFYEESTNYYWSICRLVSYVHHHTDNK